MSYKQTSLVQFSSPQSALAGFDHEKPGRFSFCIMIQNSLVLGRMYPGGTSNIV